MAFKLKGYSYPGTSPYELVDVTKPGVTKPGEKTSTNRNLSDMGSHTGLFNLGTEGVTFNEGINVDGEYVLSHREMMTPGAKRELLKQNPNMKFHGEEKARITANRAKDAKMKKKGYVKDWETGEYKKIKRA